ncbi:MAG: redoxin family protein [Bacteroidaceae bacterium]|nr:redoxin family protein [Bacteroidaceae bacterium]
MKVGDERFTVVSADGIELDKFTQTNKDGRLMMTFHFPPLPDDTKSFDLTEGDQKRSIQIKGIKPVEERWQQLLPSYWCNQQGDWKIAFLKDYAIYDCKFWSYKSCDINTKTGKAEMVITNGNDELKVSIGKNHKGSRTITIGNEKGKYKMITSRFLPDYPTKDTRTDFVDNGYKLDTVTVVGWLKDMPEDLSQLKTFDISYTNLFTDKRETVNADLDEQGRFTVKLPIVNSTEFFCDWRRCFVRTMLEPGKTYFMLYDFKEGRRYFMGDDCRLQNELFKYPNKLAAKRIEDGEDLDKYIDYVDSILKVKFAEIDQLSSEHPTLSTRYNSYKKGCMRMQLARDLAQARFITKDKQLTDKARRYAYDNFWTKIDQPYTLHHELSVFLTDYLDDATLNSQSAMETFNLIDHLNDIAANDEERALLSQWNVWKDDAQARIDAEPTVEDKERLAKEIIEANAEMIAKVDKIFSSEKTQKYAKVHTFLNKLKNGLYVLDSLKATPFIKDVWLARMAYLEIDWRRTSLLPEIMDSLRAKVTNPICLAMVEKQNDHYLAIENRDFDKLVLKSSDNLKDLSDGEALLKKILEPFKGKFVLLDIWGTWCGPCKNALSHSTEEYERLKDYDIEFLYLANNSPQESWENVIKEYNVSGPNVAHYNLPAEQQKAIERYLNVHSFPTYKLFDRNGRLLDLKVDAHNLDSLVQFLDKIK